MKKRLIIGYEGSDQGEDAVEYGRALCDVIGAEPVLVSVIPPTHPSIESFGPEAARDYRRQELLEVAGRRLGGWSPDLRSVVGGSIGHGLINAAEELDAVCIVIGSCHRGAVGRVALGSVGGSLIHGAPCAVAVAPAGYAANRDPVLHMGIAFDGTPEAWAALETGIGMVERAHGRLSIFTVSDFTSHVPATAFNVLTEGEMTNAERKEKRRVLDLALARVPQGLPVEGTLLKGDAGHMLSQASQAVDLMIIGSKGYGPIRRVFAGSVAAHVMHHAHSAVIVLPRGKGIDPLGAGNARAIAGGSR
jgi:nucleotide-binding universal stress UspA family protein